MTREIKFLAWDIQQQVMSEPFELWGIVRWPGSQGASLPTSVSLIAEMARRGEMILLQFTELLDKHGREIYEGDVLRVHRGYQKNRAYHLVPEWGVHQAEVRYVDGCVIFKIGNEAIPLFHLEGKKCLSTRIHEQAEVLGNIYEDPDLSEPQVRA